MKKVIFISIFEGVEAKNILRTPILDTLLQEPNIQIVLFTKSQERVEYYKKTFNDPRFIYEVVKPPNIRGLDVIFSVLKFTLLRTRTTDLKRRMALTSSRNYALFFAASIINRLFARPFVRKLFRFLDLMLVRNTMYDQYFERYKPSLVFLAHLFDEPEIHLLRATKKRKIKSIGFINSWDKVTARSILRLLPDKCVVFNAIVKEELMTHNEIKENDIFIGGLPQYDSYLTTPPTDKREFFKKIGFGSDVERIIVYAPNGRYSASVDGGMIDVLLSFMKEKQLPSDVGLLVRFQPNDFVDPTKFTKSDRLVYQMPGIRFSGERGVDWDMDTGDIKLLINTLYHATLFVCYTSSLSVDAAVFDKPIINIKFELKPSADLRQSPTLYYEMDHYRKAVATGGIKIVQSKDELLKWILLYLNNSSLDHQERRRLVSEQCGIVDGKAGERIGTFILNYLHG